MEGEQQQQQQSSSSSSSKGPVTCASWIKRSENKHLVVMGYAAARRSPPLLEIYSYDSITCSLSHDPVVRFELAQEGGDPRRFAVHPSGDEFVCAIASSCRLFELSVNENNIMLLDKALPPLESTGAQKFLAFSTDGSKLVTAGEDGHLRIFSWSSLRTVLDEPRAHKAFRDIDISLDSEFLATTSTDGSARIWKLNDGVPVTSLARNPDERIECCRFSRDGTKPFLFCTVQKGGGIVTTVWDISTWKKIGYKRLLRKPTSVLSISLDGKYLALGSTDGDMCVVDVKKMEISHWSKELHLGTRISSIEFCPTERVTLSTSNQWGPVITKLNVPPDWKDWQLYLVLLGFFLASLLVFYILYENSDSFWNFPLGRNQPARLTKDFIKDSQLADDQSPW